MNAFFSGGESLDWFRLSALENGGLAGWLEKTGGEGFYIYVFIWCNVFALIFLFDATLSLC